ncbi:hypothetical protein G4Y79_20020 [Phototrophicus methaneseepsis]|uniref:Uncharacterized protein n=1 Tax=Phototrophicus methaneseepsis TaxID=2710758 RepID=A0A7S8E7T5_9CHLR|nr:hypothetical protein [Phototrophicus methaneseepsis]QPC81951.1 hypothetical protein G4Y79_20020 [Phototrophicus methaneseepsis]
MSTAQSNQDKDMPHSTPASQNQPEETKQQTCSITFRIYDNTRYEIFRRFYLPLERWTQDRSGIDIVRPLEETAPPRPMLNTPADWLMLLLPKDLETLNLPDVITSEKLLTQWADIDVKARLGQADTSEKQRLADFMDLIDFLNEIDFTMTNCEKISPDAARLSLIAPQTPLKKRYILEELLMFFGLFIIIDSDC